MLELNLAGHILLLEINRAAGLGHVGRALTQMILSGVLAGVVGVAIGHLEGFEDYTDRGRTILDVLRDRLANLGVPILAGLPIDHDANPRTVTLGIHHQLDANDGTLTATEPAANSR